MVPDRKYTNAPNIVRVGSNYINENDIAGVFAKTERTNRSGSK